MGRSGSAERRSAWRVRLADLVRGAWIVFLLSQIVVFVFTKYGGMAVIGLDICVLTVDLPGPLQDFKRGGGVWIVIAMMGDGAALELEENEPEGLVGRILVELPETGNAGAGERELVMA